uniref:Stage 0 sporulation protein n=1 Tax=Candidatus Caldatribacterium californiense TaxID=1454726 RepID=A0A7V3YMG4_9BACT
MIPLVGVRFEGNPKVYYFDPRSLSLEVGERCVVETILGLELGEVMRKITVPEVAESPKPVLRRATETDLLQWEINREKERDAFEIAWRLITQYALPMKLLQVHYTLDRGRLVFYFGAEDRVDFRQLVKDLAAIFRTRIEMRQLGVRDEARLLGGYGMCGRELCCSSFLSNFDPISIRMAKEQNLVLNSAKISGVCGRLMCCLAFEYPLYRRLLLRFPRKGSKVITPMGLAKILEVNVFRDSIRLELEDGREVEITEEEYNRYFL